MTSKHHIDERTVATAEAHRVRALLDGDAPALGLLLSDDMNWVHGSGKIDSKSSLIAAIASGSLLVHRLDHSDVTIRSYGDLALVAGTFELDATGGGNRRQARNRFCALWCADESGLRLVHFQSTRL